MTLTEFIKSTPLDNSLLIGFYGGGNYGDELLMEILAGLFKKQGIKDSQITYQYPRRYRRFHHTFGYQCVDIHSPRAMLKAIRHKKQLVVGGGGLWGMDCNLNTFLMSAMLLFSRWFLGKKVYLLSVGYYDSATRLGRWGAWLAGKAAHTILARDQESYTNFVAINSHTVLDTDIAWYIKELDLTSYQHDLASLEKSIRVENKTLFITLRRFRGARRHHLAAVVASCLKDNPDQPIIIALLEPRHIDPDGYSLLQSWQRTYPNIQILDFGFNPIALFLFFRKYRRKLLFFGPQFHAILSAHLTGVPFLPLAYDNKVENLLRDIAPKRAPLSLHALSPEDVQQFIASS
jgi:polysaccharide pyruvyl transferase WcaK-like protein